MELTNILNVIKIIILTYTAFFIIIIFVGLFKKDEDNIERAKAFVSFGLFAVYFIYILFR